MSISKKTKNYFANFKFSLDFALKLTAYLVLFAYVIIIAFGNVMFQPMSTFWRSVNIFGTAAEFNVALRVISYVIFFLGASWAVRLTLRLLSYPLKKGKALVDITCSLIKYAAVIVPS